MDYTTLVESIADHLLTEIVKVSLGHPTSTNVRYGALFGDIIKKARAEGEELGLKGADRLNVVPAGGAGATLKGGYAFRTDDGVKSIPPAIYLGTPSEKTGGLDAAKQTIAHEVGHWLKGHVEERPKKELERLPKFMREVEAIGAQRDFSRRHGIPQNKEIEQANLNSYRRGVMRPAPLSTEGEKFIAGRDDKETAEAIAVLQNKFDVGKREGLDTTSRRVVQGKKIYLNPDVHQSAQMAKIQGYEED